MQWTYCCEYPLSRLFVDHLDHPDDSSPYEDGHAKDGLGFVTSLLVNGGVKSLVLVSSVNIQSLCSVGHETSDPFTNGKPLSK